MKLDPLVVSEITEIKRRRLSTLLRLCLSVCAAPCSFVDYDPQALGLDFDMEFPNRLRAVDDVTGGTHPMMRFPFDCENAGERRAALRTRTGAFRRTKLQLRRIQVLCISLPVSAESLRQREEMVSILTFVNADVVRYLTASSKLDLHRVSDGPLAAILLRGDAHRV
jgi:hypothetical protein